VIEDDGDDGKWPSGPDEGMTDDQLRQRMATHHERPLLGIQENEDHRWFDGNPRFEKRSPTYGVGWWFHMDERARFLKRWFDFPDLGKRGWAIIFQDFPPPGPDCEWFLGWVPPEREAEADGWIAFMNAETQRLLREDAAETAKASRKGGP